MTTEEIYKKAEDDYYALALNREYGPIEEIQVNGQEVLIFAKDPSDGEVTCLHTSTETLESDVDMFLFGVLESH